MKCNYKQKAWNLFLLKAFIWFSKNNSKIVFQSSFDPLQQYYYEEQGLYSILPFSFGSVFLRIFPKHPNLCLQFWRQRIIQTLISAQYLEIGIIRQLLLYCFYIFIFLKSSVEVTESQRLKCKNTSLKYLTQTLPFCLPPKSFGFI